MRARATRAAEGRVREIHGLWDPGGKHRALLLAREEELA